MKKYLCKKCGKVWYTANNNNDMKCEECNGELIEEDIQSWDNKDKKQKIIEKKLHELKDN